MPWILLAVLLALALLAGAAVWLRTHPSPLPYSQRFFVQGPHPFLGRQRLREILEPQPGERVLEVGPGTGYYTLDLAEWVGDEGVVEILDIQQEMLDHTMQAAQQRGIANIRPTQGDARSLPHEGDSFDAAVLVTVLGEISDQDAALRELERVLKPGGRLVVGELFGDPHMVTLSSLRRRAEAASLVYEGRVGPKL